MGSQNVTDMDRDFAAALNAVMKVKRITQQEVAEWCGKTQRSVSHYLNADRPIGLHIAERIAEQLGVSYRDMIDFGRMVRESPDSADIIKQNLKGDASSSIMGAVRGNALTGGGTINVMPASAGGRDDAPRTDKEMDFWRLYRRYGNEAILDRWVSHLQAIRDATDAV